MTSRLAPKPTDPALSPGLDNATQRAHGNRTYANTVHPFSTTTTLLLLLLLTNTRSHLYVRLEVEQVDLLPVAAVQGQDVPRLREKERHGGQETEKLLVQINSNEGFRLNMEL